MRKTVIIVGLIALAAFLVRVLPHLNTVFTPYGVAYFDPDSWYQMRLVDNMTINFPHPLWHDAYAIYPDGAASGYRPVLTWLISGIALLVSWGSPPPGLVDAIGAYIVPVIASLTVICIYFLGAIMFKNRWVGIMASALAAFLPTEFFHRGLLGFTDHHIFEAFFSTLVLLFIVLAWEKNNRLWGVPAGISLGLYLLNWHGSFFFVGFFVLAFCLAFLWDYFKQPHQAWWRAQKYQAWIICFTVGAVMYLPFLPFTLNPAEFGVASVAMVVLPALLVFGGSVVQNKRLYAGGLVFLSAGAVLVIYFMTPWLWEFAIQQLRTTFWGFGTTIREVLPMGLSSILIIYGLTLFFALVGIALSFRYRACLPVVLWSIVIILASLGERRWGYYAAVNISLFAAFFVVWSSRYLVPHWRPFFVGFATAALIICCLPGINSMMKAQSVITKDWQLAMSWLRVNSLDPFGGDNFDPDAYYQITPDVQPSYSVLSWWDYGHFIIRDARRVPISSPTYQETVVGWSFFIAQSEEEADVALEGWNVRYIIIDYDMVEGKFYAMVLKSGQTQMTLQYWQNSMAYQLYYGLVVGKYRAVFITPTVKVFEVFG